MVRINFEGGTAFRERPSFSDKEAIPEADYDWSRVPGALLPGEDVRVNLERRDKYWQKTGYASDPQYYEVYDSPWIRELGLSDHQLRHYLAEGQDEYFEVIARGWSWEAGQRA